MFVDDIECTYVLTREHQAPIEKEEVGAGFFLLYFFFFFNRYPTHHRHIGMKTASTTDYTVVWALDTFFFI